MLTSSNLRIGNGVDVHPLVKGKKLILGGIHIEHHSGCAGHSDGDVLIHSVIDAILGAMNEGDIGDYFPSSDDKYKNANSQDFLNEIVTKLNDKQWAVMNIDSTVILQDPIIKPYIEEMKTSFPPEWPISIKATTTDYLGFIGEGKGIAVIATCLLKKI